MGWFRDRKRLRTRVLDLEDALRRLGDRYEELDDKLRRYMGRENQRSRREALPPPSTPDSSGSLSPGEEYLNWVNDPISRKIRAERAQARARRSELSGTTDRATSSETSSEASVTPLVPPLPGWPR
jgi:hypothetical protein